MSLLLYLLGGGLSPTPAHEEKGRERNRLHKEPPERHSNQSFYSCNEFLNVFREQSCLKVFHDTENSSKTDLHDEDNEKATNTKPHIGFLLEQSNTKVSEDSISSYGSDSMELQTRRRTRAKTPVFAVGQLERNSKIQASDRAKILAEEYQALLPHRSMTPYLDLEVPKLTPRKLRKIKCQLSLRDLVKDESKHTHSVAYSDAETLVGFESPTSATSPTEENFDEILKLPVIQSFHDQPASLDPVAAALDDDIGLKICVDLLTNELATAFYRQHPAEREDRASGLQILLMIEAYETVQQHVRQQLCDPNVTEQMKDHVKSVDRILKCWLNVLYSVYDHSQEKKVEQKGGGDPWPLCESNEVKSLVGDDAPI